MLTIVSLPIGNPKDLTIRAKESLQKADLIICEELRPAETFLKRHDIFDKELVQLNEHSRPQDLKSILERIKSGNAVLISDCGTPGFCDPGADLVELCYQNNIPVDINPGPSSLMALLSLTGIKTRGFYFAGFLPQETELRGKRLAEVKKYNSDFVLMDTPYRLNKTLEELLSVWPEAHCVLGMDLTGKDHRVVRGKLKVLIKEKFPKLPFVLYVSLQ